MTTDLPLQNMKNVFTFPFQDPHWVRKMGIGFIFFLASITIILFPLIIFLYGYVYRIMKRIISENGEPYLPEWENWKQLFVDGLRIFIPQMVFMLPLFLLFIPFVVFPIFLSSYTPDGSILTIPDTLQTIIPIAGIIGFTILFGLVMLFTFGLGLLFPVILCHIVSNDQVTAAFKIREWWPIYKVNLPGFLIAFFVPSIISSLFSLPLGILGASVIFVWLLPFILALMSVYILFVSNSLYAQAYVTGVLILEGND